MSKNTERGIGLQGGPADGPAEPTAPTGKSPKPSEGAQTDRAGSEPQRHAAVDARPVTLLGVPSPLSEREKVTALGRDVHLPAETHRVATSRPIASAEEVPGPVTARGSGVEPPKKSAPAAASLEPAKPEPSQVEMKAALDAGGPGPSKPSPGVPERTPPLSQEAKPTRPTNPADRATFDASPLVVGEESSEETFASGDAKAWLKPSLRPSIGLGIGMAFALSIGLVSIVRFTALDEGDEEPYADESVAAHRPAPPLKRVTEPEHKAVVPPPVEPAKTVPTGATAVEPAETKPEETKPEETLDLLPSLPVAPGKDPQGKDARRAVPRGRGGAIAKKSPTGDSAGATATGGSGIAANAGPAVTPPPTTPKPATPNQPYDPDSPLPPAGE